MIAITHENVTVALNAIGGLAILLLGLETLSTTLQKINQKKIADFLLKFAKTPLRGVATGTAATIMIGSSSITIILLIAFIDSGLISFSNSIGIVLGANIGTTISSQIIAFNAGQYAVIPLIISVLGGFFFKKQREKFYFNATCGLSMIFYGLHLVEMAVYPYRQSPEIAALMSGLQNPFYGAAIGALITAVIQSSSATIGIAIVLSSQGIVSLESGIAVMLGAEIGTCLDTLIAAIGRKKEALKLGIFHLMFNITFVLLGLTLFSYLCKIAVGIAPNAETGRKLANAHLIFNCLSAAIYLSIFALYRTAKQRWPLTIFSPASNKNSPN